MNKVQSLTEAFSKGQITRREFLRRAALLGLSVPAALAALERATNAAATIESTPDVVIVGAGIAGLAAAYFLQDYDLKVLEAEEVVGGRVVSGAHQGFIYAKGTEYLGKPEGALAKIIQALNVQLKEIPSPMDAHFHDGGFYYGEDGLALMYVERSSLEDYNRFVSTMQGYYGEYDEIPEFDLESDLAALDDITAEDWFDQLELPEIFYQAYNVTSRGLFGANLDEISALSSIPEIAFDFEDSEPIESVDELSNSPAQGEEETEAYSFVTGITEITEAIAQHLGDRIQPNATVTSVTPQDDHYLVTYVDENGEVHTLASEVIILAVPAPVALEIAPDILSEEQKTLMEQIPFAVYVTVALFSQEPIFDKAFDLAVPDGYFFTDVYDATWVQRFYDESVRDKQDSIMSVYIAPDSYEDRSLLDMSDEDILERVYQDLEKIFPDVRDKIVGYDLYRFPHAYPVMTLGAYRRLSRLNDITEGSLLLAGDYMIYPTFEAAAQSGYYAAQKAKDALED